jgi:TetR/AcrR family transcriptional regulator, copper-responsive repressor
MPRQSAPSPPHPRRRGRPRQFDPTTALDAALRTFWRRGFDGTSVDDLAGATGLNRPSLYAALGNKAAAYDAALDRYVATIGHRHLTALSATGVLADDLRGFFRSIADTVSGRDGPLGCIIACTLPAEAERSPELQRKLDGLFETLDHALKTRLRAARPGEITADLPIGVLAGMVVTVMFGLAIRGRGGASRQQLMRIADGLVTVICGPR